MDEFQHKVISVIGAARSGLSAATVLARLGANVLLSDSQSALALGPERVGEIAAAGVPFLLGASPDESLPEGTQIVVTSPGVPKSAPVLRAALQRSLPIWSEIELAYRLTNAPIVATTGTNGKTTTTLLLAAMLQAAGANAIVAGNVSADEIKRTLVDAAFATRTDNAVSHKETSSHAAMREHMVIPQPESGQPILVAEISSFQLEWVERFAPRAAILTNITPDHLNRHTSFDEYVRTKARLFGAQTSADRAILNYDDPAARAIGETALPGRRCWFTLGSLPPDEGPAGWLAQETLTIRLEPGERAISLLAAHEFPPTLPGAHSIENALAAALAAMALGGPAEAVAQAIRSFPGVAHRMEFVADVCGVRYINNSMCTNVAAAIRSLEAMDRPTVVIAGGADKALDFAPLGISLRDRAKHVVLLGTAAEKMERAFRAAGMEAFSRAESLEDAIRQANRLAVPGDAVLLSPACASFDMFRDFEARGAAFRSAVHALEEEVS